MLRTTRAKTISCVIIQASLLPTLAPPSSLFLYPLTAPTTVVPLPLAAQGRVGQGVSHGVSTVARTGARAVRGGAGMIIPSSRSAEGDGLGVGGGSGVAWDGRDGVGEAARGEDGKNFSVIFGAIRDAQVGAVDVAALFFRWGRHAVCTASRPRHVSVCACVFLFRFVGARLCCCCCTSTPVCWGCSD